MKKIKKNILFWALPLISLSSLPLAALSCGKLDYQKMVIDKKFGLDEPKPVPLAQYSKVGKLLDKKFQFGTGEVYSYWDLMGTCEATLTSYSDGDTMNFKVEDSGQPKPLKLNGLPAIEKSKFPPTFSVRISLIDTLEEHIPGGTVDPKEKALAQEDKAFAEKMLPVGSKVKVVPPDGKITYSYSRIVAHIFFGANFEKNYSVELVANGYTLPRISDDDKFQFRDSYTQIRKHSIQGILLPYFAYAFNEGIEKKRGFYNPKRIKEGKTFFKNVAEFNKMYKTHGNMMPFLEYVLDPKFSSLELEEKNTRKYSLFYDLTVLNKEDAI